MRVTTSFCDTTKINEIIIPNRSLEEQQSVVRTVIRWKRAVFEIYFLMAVIVIRKINLQNVCYQIVTKETTEKAILMTDLG